jgi:hypothetical protein
MAVLLESGVSVLCVALYVATAVQNLEVIKNIRNRLSPPPQMAALLGTHCTVCCISLCLDCKESDNHFGDM